METLTQGTRVEFDCGGLKGNGTIVGLTQEFPIVGGIYIIEPDESISNEVYQYSHFVCPQVNLKIINTFSI